MSEEEHFLARWSRRKRDAADLAGARPATAEGTKPAPEHPPSGPAPERAEASPLPHESPAPEKPAPQPAFDITRLPSLDQITAETDIRAFLAPGVPPDLTRAALRRAWASDPKIRDFVGLAEYAWDFTAPGAMEGFGPLEMTDELRRAVLDMVGRSIAPREPNAEASARPIGNVESVHELATNTTGSPVRQDAAQDDLAKNEGNTAARDDQPRLQKPDVAAQYFVSEAEQRREITHRPHGRALPK